MNAFYFPTGDNQKDSGLEIEYMLDTGAACSKKATEPFSKLHNSDNRSS